MKSGKQRRTELKSRRVRRLQKRAPTQTERVPPEPPAGAVPVKVSALAPSNSYGVPEFVERGYYIDIPFECAGCGRPEVWTGSQQKWWYEVAKGFVYSTARRCRACRRRERARRAEARRVHLEGVQRKKSRLKAKP